MYSPISVPIIKPVNGRCNLGCSYCYMNQIEEPQRSHNSVMSDLTLESTVDFFCSNQDEIEFIWHGGEPLLAGKDFYKKARERQSHWILKGKRVANFLQTNATLIDDEWAELFAELGFFVGVSLDAPASVHQVLRQTKCGSSSLEQTLVGIEHLRRAGVFNGVSCCVGRQNVDQPAATLAFLRESDLKSIKFLRIKGAGPESISADQFSDFLIAIFNLWIDIDDLGLEIRDIKSLTNQLLGGQIRECTMMGRCDQFVTVYNDGSIFACDSFANEDKLRFGSVFDNYQRVVKGDNFQSFLKTMVAAKSRCLGCDWFKVCQGGCLKDFVDSGSGECHAKKSWFETVRKTLTEYGLRVE